jgi:hypothetical protein
MSDVRVMQITWTMESMAGWARNARLRHCKRQQTSKPEMPFG